MGISLLFKEWLFYLKILLSTHKYIEPFFQLEVDVADDQSEDNFVPEVDDEFHEFQMEKNDALEYVAGYVAKKAWDEAQ